MSQLEATPEPHRRRFKNLLQRPRAQVRYILYFLASGTLLMILAFTFVLYLLSDLVGSMAMVTGLGDGVRESIQRAMISAWIVFSIVLLIFSLLSVLTGLIITHRIFGPIVPIMRQIDSIKRGDYTARGKLRDEDELQDVMQSLNELAEVLEKKAKA